MNYPLKFIDLVCKRIGLSAVVLMLALPLAAQAGDDWAFKKKLSFDTTATGTEIKEDVLQLPLLVRLHSGNFTFSEALPDGADLRFFGADGKTALPYHVDNFDPVNELANVWVALPKLSANSKADSLVMAWGNPNAESAAAAAKTYDAAQLFVYHFGDAEGVKDATANANHAKASNARTVAAGPIGAAAAFDGSVRVDVAASATLKLSAVTGFTFSGWVKPGADENGMLYAQRDAGKTLNLGLKGGTLFAAAGASKASASAALKPAIWQHVAIVAGAGKVLFYIDGKEAGQGAFALTDMGGDAVIGEGLRGELDEVALAATARAPGYILALAASESADTPMLTFAEEDGGEASASTFTILMSAVTLDGWIVIGLLIVMAIVSFYVMISKAIILAGIYKANTAFLKVFKEKSTELLMPGHAETVSVAADVRLKHSPINRLYAVGLYEISQRFEAQLKAGRGNSLSAANIDAIRAALEAAMLRENQKLNSGIVLLTIAIAGGPFLGLLGTVVGVMITFAAIAAAGDVNVNAIAPGIAAALVATVAGLVVAIPALFGYNWLASQIKNASGDTHVFVDEFLTRSAEVYSA